MKKLDKLVLRGQARKWAAAMLEDYLSLHPHAWPADPRWLAHFRVLEVQRVAQALRTGKAIGPLKQKRRSK